MRTLGLLGGMSWESTAEYYRLANEDVRARLGGLHSAPMLLWSADFAEIEQLQATGAWTQAGERLAEAARKLEHAGAEVLVLCTNTMHKVAPAIEAAVAVPLVHIVDTVAEEVRRRETTTVGLLGTRFTMEEPFWADRMAGHGVDVVTPDPEDRALVDRVVYEELCVGLLRDESRAEYLRIVGRLAERGAQGVVLGCTEIELLVGQGDTEVPLFPSTAIHVRAAVDAAMADD